MAGQVIPFERRKRQREGIMRQIENAYEAFRRCGGNVQRAATTPKDLRFPRQLTNTSRLFLVRDVPDPEVA